MHTSRAEFIGRCIYELDLLGDAYMHAPQELNLLGDAYMHAPQELNLLGDAYMHTSRAELIGRCIYAHLKS